MSLDKRHFGLLAIAGVIIAGGMLVVEPSSARAGDEIPAGATVEYGKRLLRETGALIGPNHEDPEMRFSGNNLACASCHLDIGTRPGTLSLLKTSTRYPRESRRDGGMRDLKDRINGCMERSMNGRRFPRDNIELISMELYILDLGEQYAAMSESDRTPVEPPPFVEPARAANVEAGRIVYIERCQLCHGSEGAGLQVQGTDGYVFPPLWGPDTYNNGAGMTRVLTAARFIKALMPLGTPNLNDDDAYDVSAYINSHSRPQKANLEVDFPDRRKKPVDSPYPPYADSFPHEQHKLGPFKPIRDYYEKL